MDSCLGESPKRAGRSAAEYGPLRLSSNPLLKGLRRSALSCFESHVLMPRQNSPHTDPAEVIVEEALTRGSDRTVTRPFPQ